MKLSPESSAIIMKLVAISEELSKQRQEIQESESKSRDKDVSSRAEKVA